MTRASVGWRDNVLLSPFLPMARVFGRGEVEALAWRPLRNEWEFVSFLSGDVLRYFSAPAEIGGEQLWSGHVEGRWQPWSALRLAAKGAGYFQDTVIDLSETEASRIVAPTRVRGGFATLSARIGLPGGFGLEPSVQAKRTDYRDYPGDSRQMRTGARLDWQRAAFHVSAQWFENQRTYSDRNEYTAGGRALPGTRLEFRQREGEVQAGTKWAQGGEWSLTATGGWLQNRDGASGYFNYDQQRARLAIDWARGPWTVSVDADAKKMKYLVQTVGAGIAPPARRSDSLEATSRVERECNPRWTVFAEHHWERTTSNEAGFTYRANTVLAGVQRMF
jgi:hypothetical protein